MGHAGEAAAAHLMGELWWMHQVIIQLGAWHRTVPCCGAMHEPAGLQPATGSRTASLAPCAVKYTQGCCTTVATSLTGFHAVFHWLATSLFLPLNDLSFQALGLSDFSGAVHNSLPYSSLTKQMRRQFLFSIITLFFVVVKTLQESNPGWHSMPTVTRNTSMWEKTDAYYFLLHFSCGTGTSQQTFNGMFQHL